VTCDQHINVYDQERFVDGVACILSRSELLASPDVC
jgi:hypothetical protein